MTRQEFRKQTIQNAKRIDKVTRGVNMLKLQFAPLDSQAKPETKPAATKQSPSAYARYFGN